MARKIYGVVVAGLVAALLGGGATGAQAAPTEIVGHDATHDHRYRHGDARAAAVIPGAKFTSLSAPARVLDTRVGTGTGGATNPVGPQGQITLDLNGLVPNNAEAVVLNVTGTGTTGNTFVTIWPADQDRPLASNLNLVPGQTRPNAVTVGLSLALPPRVNLYNNVGTTHLIADLAGYYAGDAAATYTAQAPLRVLDTRVGTGTGGSTSPVPAGGVLNVDLSANVPVGTTSVTFNLTGTGGTGDTFVTAYPAGSPRPLASNLNLKPGETAPNLVTVGVGADRRVSLFNNFGNQHLIADLAGYYHPSLGDPFHAYLGPVRDLDTRIDFPPGLTPNVVFRLSYTGFPPNTSAIVANVTGTDATAPTFVRVYPDVNNPPLASNLNLVAGQTAPNLVAVAMGTNPDGTGDAIYFHNNNGRAHVIFDVAGFFAPPFEA